MSFYTTRPKRPVLGGKSVLSLVATGNPPAPASVRSTPTSTVDWTPLRKAKPANYVLPAGIAWLKSLPVGVRPMALADQYPRIANALVRQWGDAKACRAYFEDLLNDRRGGRKGFPPAVLRDIRRLADYYIRNHIAIGDTFQSRALSREGPQVRSPARLQLVVG